MSIGGPPGPFPMVTINTNSGPLVVPCEPINDWLAIVAALGMDDDGKGWLFGTFTIVDRITGLKLTEGAACIGCARHAGDVLIETGIDWGACATGDSAQVSAGWTEQQKMLVSSVHALWWICDAEPCARRKGGGRG